MRKPIENGLASHAHAALVQHREGVAGAVAEREHDVVGAKLLAGGERCSAAGDRQAAHPAGLDPQVDDALRRSGSRRRGASISARIFSTTPTRRKVPMCGLAT